MVTCVSISNMKLPGLLAAYGLLESLVHYIELVWAQELNESVLSAFPHK